MVVIIYKILTKKRAFNNKRMDDIGFVVIIRSLRPRFSVYSSNEIILSPHPPFNYNKNGQLMKPSMLQNIWVYKRIRKTLQFV